MAAATTTVNSGAAALTMPDSDESKTKYVVSTTVKDPEWTNTTVLLADVPGALIRLKEENGGAVITYGFGGVARQMLELGLLDELHIGISPVIAGSDDGIAMLTYQPQR